LFFDRILRPFLISAGFSMCVILVLCKIFGGSLELICHRHIYSHFDSVVGCLDISVVWP
jgi:hypothetical protein